MIQIYIEIKNKKIHPVVLDLIGAIQNMHYNERITGILIGKMNENIKQDLKGYGIETIYNSYYKNDDDFYGDVYTNIFAQIVQESKPDIVLIGGTFQGRYIASGLGVILKTGVTADCTDIYLDNKELIQVRPAFGGNIMAEIVTQNSKPSIATIRPNIFKKAIKINEFAPHIVQIENKFCSQIKIIDKIIEDRVLDLSKSKKIIVVGNGVQNKSDLIEIEKIAKILKAEICGTKLAVQKGLVHIDFQIGLSGNSVQPDLIILFGVSGAIQFQIGMKQSKKIIAVNIDKNADIFQIAHYPIVGDLYEIIPKLLSIISYEI